MSQRRVDLFLSPDYSADLAGKSVDELRSMKADCDEVETELSYVRRLAQGRMDILDAERDRRASGGSIGDLVAALPRILADATPPRPGPAQARMTSIMAPSPDISWTRGLESLISDDTLARLPDLSDEELEASRQQLRELEAGVSETRAHLHEVIDRVETELGNRLSS